MKAISLTRPWPYCILHLGKPLDNRSRRDGHMPAICRHRGPLLIHAAKGWNKDAADWCYERGLAASPHDYIMRNKANHPAGAIVGRCRAVGHIEPWECSACGGSYGAKWHECEMCSGTLDAEFAARVDLRWWSGGYALLLADAEPTPVVPCRGALGLWTVPPEVLEQLGAA